MKVYDVTVWYPIINPEDRNSRNMSGPTRFFREQDATKYIRRTVGQGGALASYNEWECEVSVSGWISLEEFDRAGKMTADELHALRHRIVTEEMLE